MATIRLVASNYGRSNTSYVNVTDAENMYNNTDHSSNYATLRGRAGRNSNSTYYAFINGFNFSAVPSNATVTGFTIKIKAYRGSYQATGNTNYRICLASQASNNYKIGNTTISEDITTSTSGDVYTIPTGSLTWSQIVEYGSGFSIDIPLRNSSTSSSNYPYVYVYGAEIEVTYTIPVHYNVNAISNVSGISVSPASQSVLEGDDAEDIVFEVDDITGYIVTDNDVDVTSQLVRHTAEQSQTEEKVLGTYTLVSGGFNGSGATYFSGLVGKGHNSTTTTSNYYSSGSSTIAVFTYDTYFPDIPNNATITRVYCLVNGHAESTSNANEYMCVRLISGSANLSDELNFKSVGTSNSTQTVECNVTPTVAQLSQLKVQCRLGYYGGAINGATVYVEYEVQHTADHYYTYSISNVSESHLVLLDISGPYVPPEEDPDKTYYSLNVSSINATTYLVDGNDLIHINGTTRIESGTSEIIEIHPTDPLLTLALDNGVDISDQLVSMPPSNTYTVSTTASGASYGFNLNSSTGYYVSTNNGVSKSASVATVHFDFESDCIVTITYINYAEANYDYGMFGKIDTTVARDGLTASDGSSTPSDSTSNYQLAMCSNSSSTQTISYNIPAGEHYIDIKYGKDDASDDNNDSLQWKITSVTPTSAGGNYRYTLNNITQNHSLIFIFGNVSYYFVTSSDGNNCRLFPDGQSVCLSGDSYSLKIIPKDVSATVSLTDNNVDKTNELVRTDGVDKQGNPIVNYDYKITSVLTSHTLIISIGGVATDTLFLKVSGNWITVSNVYLKESGSWVLQNRLSDLFNTETIYINGGTHN